MAGHRVAVAADLLVKANDVFPFLLEFGEVVLVVRRRARWSGRALVSAVQRNPNIPRRWQLALGYMHSAALVVARNNDRALQHWLRTSVLAAREFSRIV